MSCSVYTREFCRPDEQETSRRVSKTRKTKVDYLVASSIFLLESSARPASIIMLEALSLEIMYQICDWLVRDDIQALALTSRTIARQTKPRRFLSIRVTCVDQRILETLESDPEIASAVNEIIFDFPSEFDLYTPQVSDETLSKSKCRAR